MGFLYKAFVRKNSPELREVLENIGYRNDAWEYIDDELPSHHI